MGRETRNKILYYVMSNKLIQYVRWTLVLRNPDGCIQPDMYQDKIYPTKLFT